MRWRRRWGWRWPWRNEVAVILGTPAIETVPRKHCSLGSPRKHCSPLPSRWAGRHISGELPAVPVPVQHAALGMWRGRDRSSVGRCTAPRARSGVGTTALRQQSAGLARAHVERLVVEQRTGGAAVAAEALAQPRGDAARINLFDPAELHAKLVQLVRKGARHLVERVDRCRRHAERRGGQPDRRVFDVLEARRAARLEEAHDRGGR